MQRNPANLTRSAPLWAAALLVACPGPPQIAPLPDTALAALQHDLDLGLPPPAGDPLRVVGPERAGPEGVRVAPVRLSLVEGWELTGALFSPAAPVPGAAVLVSHGHFGQGKSGAEAQEIAWRLAAHGALVLSVDSPGEEEGALPQRLIHLEGGAHGRALLRAGGASALGLQLAGLRRGIDALAARGATRVGLTGASGGAVLSFYGGLLDPRVSAVALASPPPIPREARGGGCLCDQVPGRPGPDPHLLASLRVPALWLLDHRGPPPEGLGPQAEVIESDGPHSYTAEMQEGALRFFGTHLGLRGGPLGPAAGMELAGPPLPADAPGLADLPLRPPVAWDPDAQALEGWGAPVVEARCVGAGPTVLVVGLPADAEPARLDALRAAGLRACALRVPEDEGAEAEAELRGRPWVARQAAALQHAASQHGAVAVWAARAWGLPAGLLPLPWVWEQPICALSDVDPAKDPAWVHTPGAWWGDHAAARCARAPLRGSDPAGLIGGLQAALGG
jgi:dienelactone hydrolase